MNIPQLPLETADDTAYFERSGMLEFPLPIKRRIIVERAIVRRACTDLVAANYVLRLYDGEDWATPRTIDVSEIMHELMACDEESLCVLTRHGDKFARVGSIDLVYGNDGYDVMANYTLTLEHALQGANDYADALQELMI